MNCVPGVWDYLMNTRRYSKAPLQIGCVGPSGKGEGGKGLLEHLRGTGDKLGDTILQLLYLDI